MSKRVAAALPIVVGFLLSSRLAFLGLSPVNFDLPRPLPLPDPGSTTSLQDVAFDIVGLEDSIVYPEALVKSPDGKFAFLSLGDGRIVRMTTKDTLEWRDLSFDTVVRTGEDSEDCGSGGPSDETDMESTCGRPLGMLVTRRSVIDPYYSSRTSVDEDVLLVADSYKGLLMVTNIFGDGVVRVLATRAAQDPTGYQFHHLKALVETPDGSIYFTETSTRFRRRRIFYEAMNGRPSGRLLRYSKQRGGVVDVVAQDVYMANGLDLSHDGKSLLIVSGVAVRRFDLALRRLDPKPFIDVMPGSGGNLRKMNVLPTGERRKCYWAGLGGKYARPFSLLHYLSDKAWARSVLLALVAYKKVIELVPKWTALAIYDERGELVDMMLDDGKDKGGESTSVRVPWVSEVEPLGDYLYFLSWYNPFLARIKRIDIQP